MQTDSWEVLAVGIFNCPRCCGTEQAGVTVNMKMQENALNIWFSAKKHPLSQLVQLLGEELGRPVVDKTRLNELRITPCNMPRRNSPAAARMMPDHLSSRLFRNSWG